MTNNESLITKQEKNLVFKIRYSNFRASRGYTLIEMLISVTILAGLLIIVLGTVAASSNSSAKVGTLREKTEVARTLIDQISNDFSYVDTRAIFTENGTTDYRGYFQDSERLILVLHLPKTDATTQLVKKDYQIVIEQPQQRATLKLTESRACKIETKTLVCSQPTAPQSIDLLPGSYALSQESKPYESSFGGINIFNALARTPAISPYITLAFTLKPVEMTANCGTEAGACYKVSTTLNVGGSL